MKVINHKQKGFIAQTQTFQNTVNLLSVIKVIYFTIEFPQTTKPRSHPTVLEVSLTISAQLF